MSVIPTPPRQAASAHANDNSSKRAAQALEATLYGARARTATVWFAGLGLATFGPLAMGSRNGWAMAGLMLMLATCLARWAVGWMLERDKAQAHPMMILGLHAAMGATWAAAGVAVFSDAHGHGPAFVLLSTAVVAAASVPLLQQHRDACWWLLAPLIALPVSLPLISNQAWTWPLAAAMALALGAAAWHAHWAQERALASLETTLHLTHFQTEWKKAQQEGAATKLRLDARDCELALLHEHAAMGIARVEGYMIQGINEHLAQQLGQPADHWPRRDVLSLFAKDHHGALDAAVKYLTSNDNASDTSAVSERVALITAGGALRTVDVVIARGERGGTLWLVTPAPDGPGAPAAMGQDDASELGAEGLLERLQWHAQQGQRVAVFAVALTGVDAAAAQFGRGALQRIRETTVQRLRAVSRKGDAVAVLDDAHLALVTAGDAAELAPDLMMERVQNAVTPPYNLRGRCVPLGVSVDVLHDPSATQLQEWMTSTREAPKSPEATAKAMAPSPRRDDAALALALPDAEGSASAAPKRPSAATAELERIHLDIPAEEDQAHPVQAKVRSRVIEAPQTPRDDKESARLGHV